MSKDYIGRKRIPSSVKKSKSKSKKKLGRRLGLKEAGFKLRAQLASPNLSTERDGRFKAIKLNRRKAIMANLSGPPQEYVDVRKNCLEKINFFLNKQLIKIFRLQKISQNMLKGQLPL